MAFMLGTSALAFMGVATVTGSVLACLAAGIMRESYRVQGVASWALLFVLGGIPAGLAAPMAQLVALPDNQPVVLIGMAVFLGIFWVHFFLPAALPDFHTQTFNASGFMAVVQGIAVYIAGVGTGYVSRGF